MDEAGMAQHRRAWLLAHKLITLGRAVGQREGTDLVQVTTAQLAHAMGASGPAPLEQVRAFAQQVVDFMAGYGLYTACGCGYLSLLVGPSEAAERAFAEKRELSWHTPEDVDAYLDEILQLETGPPRAELRPVCEIREDGSPSGDGANRGTRSDRS